MNTSDFKYVMKNYMGIDIGTSGCKAVVFDQNGTQTAAAYREYDLISPQTGWAELDPDEVIQKCFQVITEAASKTQPESIAALGISSQGEAFTAIDKNGKALCNALVSSDIRAAHYARSWTAKFGKDRLYKITGHTAHPMFSLFKLLWLRDNRPEIWAGAQKFLCFEDLLQFRLGLQPAIGWPLAARTMLFDVISHRWSKHILDAVGIKPVRLATPVRSGSIAGTVDHVIAKKLRLAPGAFVVTGGHDQPCSALGAGVTQPGIAAYAAGTVECITPAFKKPVFTNSLRKNNLCTYDYTVPGMYTTVAFSLTGGNLLKWFRNQFGSAEVAQAKKLRISPYELLLKQVPDKPSALLVLPYFTPTGTPYFDPCATGAIIGLTLSTTKPDIIRALLEGVALEMRLNLDILEQSGCKVDELRAIGGGAKSHIWNQLKADVIGKKIAVPDITEAGCFGVAMLAYAADTRLSVKNIAKDWIKPVSVILPRPEYQKIYDLKFEKYKHLYPALKQFFPIAIPENA
ncbi:MAG: FGGY-family carbohydrate kinase [Planctomycetota bacterium]